MKLSPVTEQGSDKVLGYMFECPGCGQSHAMWTNNSNKKCNWQFNGNMEKPSFTPSLLVNYHTYPSGQVWPTDEERDRMMKGEKLTMTPGTCHSYITDGRIQFLGDCTHKLANQTVELPEV